MTPSPEKTMTREDLHAKLWALTAKQFDKNAADLRPENRISQDLGADSLDVAELSMAVEEDLAVILPDDLMGNTNLTLGEVEEAIWAQLKGK